MCVLNIIQWASFNSLTIPRHWHRQRNTASEIKPPVLEDSKLRCWFSTRSQRTFPACYVFSSDKSSSSNTAWAQTDLMERKSIHSTRAYFIREQCAGQQHSFRSLDWQISQIKPWRTCCAKPITHAENAACSSLHTSGIHLSLMTIIFSFGKPENVFGINKRSCDKWLGIIELLKIIASPLSRCHLRVRIRF